MVPPKLRPNIVEGRYESWEHYYDTQFKLLKEDFIASLRRGICDFRKEEQRTPLTIKEFGKFLILEFMIMSHLLVCVLALTRSL